MEGGKEFKLLSDMVVFSATRNGHIGIYYSPKAGRDVDDRLGVWIAEISDVYVQLNCPAALSTNLLFHASVDISESK